MYFAFTASPTLASCARHVPGIDRQRIMRWLSANVFEEALLRRQCGPWLPVSFELARSLHRGVLRLCDHAHEVFPHDHLDHAGNVSHGVLLDSKQRSSHCRRPHHAAVQHARHSHVLHELELAGHQCSPVERRNRLTQHCPLCRRASLRRSIQHKTEVFAADQLRVGHFAAAPSGDHAVGSRQPCCRLAQLFRCELQKGFPRSSRSQRQILCVEVSGRRLAPGRAALVRRHSGVALNQLDAIQPRRTVLRPPTASVP